jgi:Flp pilus assembly protein TadD
LNDPDTAVDWLEQASSASPNDVKLLALLADAQFRAGDREAAQATIARGLAKEPTNATLRNLKGKAENVRY